MADHAAGNEPAATQTQPVGISEVIRMVVVALISAGWITLDDTAINTIVSVVGVLVSIGLTWWTGRKVTPVAKPRTGDGRRLVPSPPEKTLGPNPPPPA